MFGAAPTHFGTYFSANGVKYSKYYSFDSLQLALSKMKENQVALIGAWNGKSVSMGAHYVAVEKKVWIRLEYIIIIMFYRMRYFRKLINL